MIHRIASSKPIPMGIAIHSRMGGLPGLASGKVVGLGSGVDIESGGGGSGVAVPVGVRVTVAEGLGVAEGGMPAVQSARVGIWGAVMLNAERVGCG